MAAEPGNDMLEVARLADGRVRLKIHVSPTTAFPAVRADAIVLTRRRAFEAAWRILRAAMRRG